MSEDYVSFEIAKLLKEKGFDEPTLYHYCQNNNFPTHTIDYEYIKNSEDVQFCSAPTHQMAMKWLREVHNVCIIPSLYDGEGRFYCFVYTNNYRVVKVLNKKCDTYESVCENAIKYVLENLI